MSTEFQIRKTDSPFHDPVQSCRFVEIDGKWFFMTREKQLEGPFATKAGAEMALDIFLGEVSPSEPHNNSDSAIGNTADNNSTQTSDNAGSAEMLEGYSVEELDKSNILLWRNK